MSLATRCPACGTIFRVVQDQLKVSEGWVRCGQCHEVFHGIEALFDLDSDPAIAARRAAAAAAAAAARVPNAPPPTRVFAQQRASAPIPAATPPLPATPPTPPASLPTSPIAIPARAPAPIANAPARQSVPASPSAFGASDYPPAAPVTRPGYTGFTPATRPLAPPPAPLPPPPPPPAPMPPAAAPTPIAPVATRSTIAPRFAARLAEESARTQVLAPSQVPPRSPPPPTTAPAPLAPPPAPTAAPLTSTLAQRNTAPAWQTPPTPVTPPATTPAAFAPPPVPSAPEPVRAQTPLVTPIATPAAASAADLAAEFAAPPPATSTPAPAPTPETPASEPVVAREPAPDIDAPALPDDAAEDPRAGPPTLASMLPEDAGDWPPKRLKKRAAEPAAATSELEIVDRSKDPRFLREAKSGARWRRPWVRAVLSVTLLLLLVAAAAQVAWPQRDMLASRWPVTLPAWDWLCEQADCKIEAPRAIASLALDGSSLTRTDTEHVLLFSADLHNRADHAVRMPSFDLTFMDLNGEIVARKVLTPDEIGIHQAALPPEGELHVHARLQVGTLAASGFQADLFYP